MKEIVIRTDGKTTEITVDGENISEKSFSFDFHADTSEVTCEYGGYKRDENGDFVISEITNDLIREYVKIF